VEANFINSILLLAAKGSSQLHKVYQSRCKAKNSWWWAERLPETCRVVISVKLEFSASVGFIHKEFVTMHGHTIVKFMNIVIFRSVYSALTEQKITCGVSTPYIFNLYVKRMRLSISRFPRLSRSERWFDWLLRPLVDFICKIRFNIIIYKEPTWCNLAVCLLVTAIILYMFRTLFASIPRST
jgi:hypothetical protein